ncbi:MAG: PfkB family carbohydrate kinase [Acidiferrobacterales bacterium]
MGAAETRLGGAASFAALAATVLGYRPTVITAAPPEDDLLAALKQEEAIDLRIKPCAEPTTFQLDYAADARRLRLLNRAPTLQSEDITTDVRGTPLAYVCPVMSECEVSMLRLFPGSYVIAAIQGWLRSAADDGLVVPDVLFDVQAFAQTNLVSFSELDHPESEALARQLAEQAEIVALTRGTIGATLFRGKDRVDLPAAPANEVDPTGAGDVFGLVLGLALRAGEPWIQAGEIATRIAAHVVEGPGLGRLDQEARTLLRG